MEKMGREKPRFQVSLPVSFVVCLHINTDIEDIQHRTCLETTALNNVTHLKIHFFGSPSRPLSPRDRKGRHGSGRGTEGYKGTSGRFLRSTCLEELLKTIGEVCIVDVVPRDCLEFRFCHHDFQSLI